MFGFFFLRLFFGIIFPTLDRVQYTSVILMKPSVYRQEGKLWIIRLLRLNQNLHLSTLTTYKQRRFCYDGIQFLRFRQRNPFWNFQICRWDESLIFFLRTLRTFWTLGIVTRHFGSVSLLVVVVRHLTVRILRIQSLMQSFHFFLVINGIFHFVIVKRPIPLFVA